MEGFTHIDKDTFGGGQAEILVLDPARSPTHLVIPGGADYLHADYIRDGNDLTLKPPAGAEVIIPDYFLSETPPALLVDGASMIAPEVVARLAGPLAPGQYAQIQAGPQAPATQALGAAIGSVTELEGVVNATRVDGAQVLLGQGDPIFQGDVIETGAKGSLGIVFADDTTFSLDSDGRMVMDEMIYDPDNQTGVFKATVVKGVFSFVSGQVAKTDADAMVLHTPKTTIGIRGSTGLGRSGGEGGEDQLTLIPDIDGRLGELVVSTPGGSRVLNQANASTSVFNPLQGPSPIVFLTQQQIQQNYGQSLTVLVKTEAKKAQVKAAQAVQKAQAADEEAQAAQDEADQANEDAAAAEAEAAAAEQQAADAAAQAAADEAEAEALAAEAEALAAAAAAMEDGEAKAVAEAAVAEAQAAAAAAAAKAEAAAAQAAAQAAEAAQVGAQAAAALAAAEAKGAEAAAAAQQAAEAATQAAQTAQISQIASTIAQAQQQIYTQFVETGIVDPTGAFGQQPDPGDLPNGNTPPIGINDILGTGSGDPLIDAIVNDIVEEIASEMFNDLAELYAGNYPAGIYDPNAFDPYYGAYDYGDYDPFFDDDVIYQFGETLVAQSGGGSLVGSALNSNFYFAWDALKSSTPVVSYTITDGGGTDQIAFDNLDEVTVKVSFGANATAGEIYIYDVIAGTGSLYGTVTFSGIDQFLVSDVSVAGFSHDDFTDSAGGDVLVLGSLEAGETGYVIAGTDNAETITITTALGIDDGIVFAKGGGDIINIETIDNDLTLIGGYTSTDNVFADSADYIPDSGLNEFKYSGTSYTAGSDGLRVDMNGYGSEGGGGASVKDVATGAAFHHELVDVAGFTGSAGDDDIFIYNGSYNYIDGDDGNDDINISYGSYLYTLNGGYGDDTLIVDDGVFDTATSIYDDGGTDSLTVKFYSGGTLDVSAGPIVTADFETIAFDASNSTAAINLTTTSAAETIYGSAFGDTIDAGDGANSISGGYGVDTLTGGSGVDTYVYSTAYDSYIGGEDSITNFNAGGNETAGADLIDLSAFKVGTLAYVGDDMAFTGGNNTEVRLITSSSMLQIDVNGDGTFDASDMQIDVSGYSGTFDATDFV